MERSIRVAKKKKSREGIRKGKRSEGRRRKRGREMLTNWKAVKPKQRHEGVVGCKEKRASMFGEKRSVSREKDESRATLVSRRSPVSAFLEPK